MLRRATGLMLDSANVTPLDGRVARSRRTRAAIVEALVSLLEEGNPQPTVEEIAARASVAPRTVFQHYADREALFAAVSEHREAQLRTLMGQIDPAAPLRGPDRRDRRAARAGLRVDRRGPPRRAADGAVQRVACTRRWRAFRAEKRAELERVFATEIAAAPEDDRAALVAALGVAGSWSSWDALRGQQELDVERRRRGAAADAARAARAAAEPGRDCGTLERMDRVRVRAPELDGDGGWIGVDGAVARAAARQDRAARLLDAGVRQLPARAGGAARAGAAVRRRARRRRRALAEVPARARPRGRAGRRSRGTGSSIRCSTTRR